MKKYIESADNYKNFYTTLEDFYDDYMIQNNSIFKDSPKNLYVWVEKLIDAYYAEDSKEINTWYNALMDEISLLRKYLKMLEDRAEKDMKRFSTEYL